MPLEDLEVLPEEVEEQTEEDECIQIVKKPVKKAIYKKKEVVEPVEPKPKKERSEKAKLAWEKCLATRAKNREDRKKVKEQDDKLLADYKKQLAKKTEHKIVKKAVGIKKKQIIREEEIDEISEDETPIEVVKKIIKDRRKAKEPKAEPIPQPQMSIRWV